MSKESIAIRSNIGIICSTAVSYKFGMSSEGALVVPEKP
jgi:hypothetical protein